MNEHHDLIHDDSKTVKRTLLFIATAGSFLTPFMISSINIALPAIQKEFAADAVVLSWIATSFLLSSAVFLLPIGKLADILGRTRLYKWGIISFTAFTLASGFVPNIELLIMMRVLQGISASMIATAGMALITSVFPPQERGKALGFNVSAIYVGLGVGPFLGGFLTKYWDWRSIFLVLVPLGVLITVLTITYVKSDWADAKNDKLDIPGSMIFAVTLIALIYGSSILPDILGIILILFSIVCFVFFVKRQLKVPNPVLEIRLFQDNRVFAFSNVAALINYAGSYSVTFLLSLYLQYVQGMSSEHAGIILIIQPIIQSLISPLAGRISDKKEPANIASLGMAATAAGLFLLSFIGPHTSLFLIIAALMVLGIGFALFSSPNTNAVMSSVDKHYYGIASASVSVMRVLGQMLSMATATLLISIFVGKNQITPEYYPQFLQSIHLAFLISACFCAVGIFFSLARGKIHVNNIQA
ncbi:MULTISPECIES: MFS transporter [unclassified Dehalobacter]|uniref:MFS transporter n=1 Tax=unclassified Dehalobacter TaxID=2635733 RepID=UPI000E6B6231|nr:MULTISPECIES: MFS transporter [unclassified Dehalobacter]RJE48181.1 MFS transporter [Dehalobacter sp. MCB1]TCX49658.1 MFS transporter [Dehalobacter sp. 14DCB1]TCX50218.1 MFS transporter [Dehalobacter sp. 12DCB1]